MDIVDQYYEETVRRNELHQRRANEEYAWATKQMDETMFVIDTITPWLFKIKRVGIENAPAGSFLTDLQARTHLVEIINGAISVVSHNQTDSVFVQDSYGVSFIDEFLKNYDGKGNLNISLLINEITAANNMVNLDDETLDCRYQLLRTVSYNIVNLLSNNGYYCTRVGKKKQFTGDSLAYHLYYDEDSKHEFRLVKAKDKAIITASDKGDVRSIINSFVADIAEVVYGDGFLRFKPPVFNKSTHAKIDALLSNFEYSDITKLSIFKAWGWKPENLNGILQQRVQVGGMTSDAKELAVEMTKKISFDNHYDAIAHLKTIQRIAYYSDNSPLTVEIINNYFNAYVNLVKESLSVKTK